MLPVLALAVHEHRRPVVSYLDWRPALARDVEKTNPFTGAPIAVKLFVPDLEVALPPSAMTYAAIRLADAAEWQRGRELLAEHSARLTDGHLAELWMLAMPSSDAIDASMRPSWVSTDADAYLLPFPAVATGWLARLPEEGLRREAGRLADICAWLADDADADLLEVAHELLTVVRPLAVLAERRGGLLSAHLRLV
jgi:hypothetical protein